MISSIISFNIITFYLFCHLALSPEQAESDQPHSGEIMVEIETIPQS